MTLFKAGGSQMPMAYPVQEGSGRMPLVLFKAETAGNWVIGPGLAVNQAERTG